MPDEQIEKAEEVATVTPTSSPTDLSQMTNADLRNEIIKLGMPEEDAQALTTSKALLAVLNTLRAQAATLKVDPGLTAAIDPTEDRKTEQQWTSKAHRQWDHWDKQAKVKIIVPLNGKEKQGVIRWVTDPRMKRLVPVHVSGAVQSVIENGATYLIPKGVYSEVPEPVARIIEQKFQQTSEAGAEIKADRVDPETGRTVLEQLT